MVARDICRKVLKTVPLDMTVQQAMQYMVEKNINSLIVSDSSNRIAGLLSIPDIAAAIVPIELQENIPLAQAMAQPGFFIEMCKQIAMQPIQDIMYADVVTVLAEADIMEIVAIFLHQKQHTIPVVDKSQNLVGIVTRTEVRSALAYAMTPRSDTGTEAK